MNKAHSRDLYFSNDKSTSAIHSYLIKGYQASCCNLLLSYKGYLACITSKIPVIHSLSSIKHDITVTKHHVLPGSRSLASNYYIRFVTSVVRRFILYIPCKDRLADLNLFSIICKAWPDSVMGDVLQVYMNVSTFLHLSKKTIH